MLKMARVVPALQARAKRSVGWREGRWKRHREKAKDGLGQESAALKGGWVGKDDVKGRLTLCICKGNFCKMSSRNIY